MRALDWYLIVCYLLVFGSFAEYAVVNYTSKFHLRRRNVGVKCETVII